MANFPCNPQLYLPLGAHVEHGWLRPARSRVALGGEPPRRHEEYAIITLTPEPPEDLVPHVLQEVAGHLEQIFPVRILSHFRSPLGLGLFQFENPDQRQILLDHSPIAYLNNSQIRVIKHDEARNFRVCPYVRLCRLMILAFPLDYQNMDFFNAAVAPFGRLITWHEGQNKSKTFIDCLVLSPDRIPSSIVVSRGSLMGGNGCSWSAPVYIIGGHFPDAFPGEEDPVPLDGNPHPAHGHIVHAVPAVPQNWINDLAGAAEAVVQDFGVNVEQMHQAMNDVQMPEDNNQAMNVNDWPAWDAVADNDANQDPIQANQQHMAPQHPEQPQDSISFDESGSTVEYFRAHGPDIHLSVEMIMQNQGDSSSSSSSEVSSFSNPVQDNTGDQTQEEAHWFSALCKVILPVVQAAIPSPPRQMPLMIGLKRSWDIASQPIMISRDTFLVEQGMSRAIVPYDPVLHSVQQRWSQELDELSSDQGISRDSAHADNLSNMELDNSSECLEDQRDLTLANDGDEPVVNGSSSKDILPGLPPRPKKSVISLPTRKTVKKSATPLVASSVRKSSRLNESADGYQHCQLQDTPRKRRKNSNAKSLSLGELPNPQGETPGPIPLEVLKGECGVSPSEITKDQLLQKQQQVVPDDDANN